MRLRENKPEVCWREDLIQDVSRNHPDCFQTGTLIIFTSFTDAEATGCHDDQYNKNCNSVLFYDGNHPKTTAATADYCKTWILE